MIKTEFAISEHYCRCICFPMKYAAAVPNKSRGGLENWKNIAQFPSLTLTPSMLIGTCPLFILEFPPQRRLLRE